jgi:LysM repeat protein
MRTRILGTVAALSLAVPATAAAQFPHVVSAGETLSSIASVDGLSVAQLAAENGISPDSQLIAGATLLIPPQGSASGALAPSTTTTTTTSASRDGDADADDGGATSATPVSTSSAGTTGGYLVQPGDTLSAIAARAGVSVAQLAAVNGLDPAGLLLAGRSLSVPGATQSTTGTAVPVSTTVSTPTSTGSGGPYPTPVTLDSGTVGSIGAASGVPGSLTQAVGWQESGFNNGLVSATGAVGVMQIEPGTWSYINQILTPGAPLDPYSATDNVRAGSLYLRSLLASTGSASMAAAAYYQGLSSVQQHGLYSDTQQYVNDVMSLQSQYGGG